jgi:hypothetical protein
MKLATILILALTALIMCSENENMRNRKRNRNEDKKLSEAFKKIIDIVEIHFFIRLFHISKLI